MSLTAKQVEMLTAVRDGAATTFHTVTCDALEKSGMVKWIGGMRLVGCNSFSSSSFVATEAGAEALHQVELGRLGKAAMRAIKKLSGGKILCRGYRPEASGYDYWVEPGHRPFPELSAAYLIAHGHVRPQGDGLFAGHSQTFVVA